MTASQDMPNGPILRPVATPHPADRCEGIDAGIAGFSLVEMLVVMAILALVAGLTAPAIGHLLPDRRLDTTAAALSTEMVRLRAQARRSGTSASLIFDPLQSVFVSTRSGAAAISARTAMVEILKSDASRSGPGEIRFLADGSSTGGAIRLSGSSGSRLGSVSSLTGRVIVAETQR